MEKSDAGKMTVVAFVGDAWEHVCPRVRLVGPLTAAGVRLVHGNDWDGQKSVLHLERVDEADLVVIQRDFPSQTDDYDAVVARVRSQGKPLLYEIDDLLPEVLDHHPAWDRYVRKGRFPIARAAVDADAVTVSTSPLAGYFSPINPNTFVLPNYLDDSLWPLRPSDAQPAGQVQDATVRLGYLGSPAHEEDLNLIVPVLLRLLKRYEGRLTVQVWGMVPPLQLRDSPHVSWDQVGLVDYTSFAAYFSGQRVDIVVAPLLDTPFNRCKSALKFLEYSSLAVPGVYAAIEPYRTVVNHGQNGYLAATTDEWEECLSRLIETPSLRRELGYAALESVRRNWLLTEHAGLWPEVYREILSRHVVGNASVASHVALLLSGWHQDTETRLAAAEDRVRKLDSAVAVMQRQSAEANEQLRLLQSQASEKDRLIESLTLQLDRIRSSFSWSLVTRLWKWRQTVAPVGSRREAILKSLVRGLRLWRQHGFGTVVRALSQRLRRGGLEADGYRQSEEGLELVVVPGERCPIPCISLVLTPPDGQPGVSPQDYVNWARAQSCPGVEVVTWDGATARVCDGGKDARAWPAGDMEALCHSLQTRYVCFASPFLLNQSTTYLEANLLTLVTEDLAFTVNFQGDSQWARSQLLRGLLPGHASGIFERMVVRADRVRNGPELDLADWLPKAQPGWSVVGKLIEHETSQAPAEQETFTQTPAGVQLRLLGSRFLAAPANAEVAAPPSLRAHPVDTVMPADVVHADLPTVLLLTQFFAVGGAERVALDMMCSLKERIRFVVMSLDKHQSALGTTVDAFRQLTPYVYCMPDYLSPQLNASFLRYLIDRFQPQVLYVANGSVWVYQALPEVRRRYPHLRMANQVYDHEAGWINHYNSRIASIFDANIGVNRRIAQAYLDRGVTPDRVFLIENAVDGEDFDPSRYSDSDICQLKASLGLPTDGKVVTFIGRLHPQKRPMDFVELARRFDSDPTLTFLMVGDGPLAETVDAELARLRLPNLVRHAFYKPSRDIFAVSDLVVLPSEYEGMPLAVMEAQAMGKPVVVTDVGNNRELLDLTGGGVVVPQIGDVGSLRQAVSQVLAQPPDPQRMRREMLSHFSPQRIAEKYRRALLGE